MIQRAEPLFGPSLFQFLRDLKDNNNRAWFQANKARYEAEVKGPVLTPSPCAPEFLARFTGLCRDHAPLAAFLAKALRLPW